MRLLRTFYLCQIGFRPRFQDGTLFPANPKDIAEGEQAISPISDCRVAQQEGVHTAHLGMARNLRNGFCAAVAEMAVDVGGDSKFEAMSGLRRTGDAQSHRPK